MVVLNLYPRGTLEYDDKEIRSTGTGLKATVLFKDVVEITFDEPTRLKNGIITIKTTSNKKISCIFRKKHLENAKIAYDELIEIKKNIPTEYLQQKEELSTKEEKHSKYVDCPLCNNPMKSHKSTGFLASGIDYTCENCQLKLHYFEDKYRLEEIKENSRLQLIYKNKKYTLSEWKNICSGHYSEEEDMKLSKLEFEETTDISCPICNNLFDKYHDKGILTFDLLVCPMCESKFEIWHNGIYRFINSPSNDLKLWDYYKKELTMNEFYDIMGKSNNVETPNDIEENKYNLETKKIEKDEQTPADNIIENNTKDNNTSNNPENQITTVNKEKENNSIFCQNCGTKILQTSKFCMECGNPIIETPNNNNETEETLLTNESNNNQNNIPIEKNENTEIKKTETLPAEETTKTVNKFEEKILSHSSTPSHLKCPSCNKTMQTYQEKGFLSGGNYHYCLNCNINFKELGKTLSLNDAPINTKLYHKLKNKNLTLDKWHRVFECNLTDEEIEKINELTYIGQTQLNCPSCSDSFGEYKTDGLRSSHYLICNTCSLMLKKHSNDKYSLENTTEIYSQLWKHKDKKLTLTEIKQIYENDTSEIRIQHLRQLVENKQKIALFMESLESGNTTLATPITNTTIVLKSGEKPIYQIDNVILSEPRAVRTTTGGYGGASVRVSKNITVHSGRTQSTSESHDEIKVIDNGALLITNKRIVFLGTNRTTNIDLNKIIAITDSDDTIAIQRSNKQKVEYFSNIKSQQLFKVEDKEIEVTLGGTLLKKLIIGLI